MNICKTNKSIKMDINNNPSIPNESNEQIKSELNSDRKTNILFYKIISTYKQYRRNKNK